MLWASGKLPAFEERDPLFCNRFHCLADCGPQQDLWSIRMKKTLGVVIGVATLAWAVCAVGQVQEKTELQYIQTLRDAAHGCAFSQGLANSAMKLNISRDFSQEQAQKATQSCVAALDKGEAAFKAEIARPHRPAVRDGVKKVYSRWRTYVESVGSGPVDVGAERGFNDAVNDLKLEVENP